MKLFVCDLSSRLESTLSDFEAGLRDNFASSLSEIDPSSGGVEFDLASVIGRTQGVQQCRSVYARCRYDYDTVLGVIRESAARAAGTEKMPQ
jgi:hypothetical protein